ncbi:imine reductase family protein [Amycolatopsis jiangsuensis]
MSGFLHASALVGTAGVSAAEFLPEVMQLFRAIPGMIAADGVVEFLPRAVREHYRRAIADGHGADGWTRIIDGIRAPRR